MIENNKEFEVGDNIIATLNEDDMSILNNKKLLYSDVITLIIADFLQEYVKNNEFVAIISTSNVSNDQENIKLNQNVKSLFDNDIIKFYNNLNKVDPNHENKEKLKNLLYELMNIENQIKIYQNLILEKSSKGNNVKHLMNMVKKLNEQHLILQKKINQFNISSKKKSSKVADISIINSNATNSIFRSSVDKINTAKKGKNDDKNNLLKVVISNSKSHKSLKQVKNTKYKLASNSSNNSINSKRVVTSNSNYNSNNAYNVSNTNPNNALMTDIYGANSQSTNANENSLSNIINDNVKYNYYYNNDNFYYQHGVKYPESKEELRNNNLLEIFYFYTKQHTFIGKTPTFQEILKSEEHLDLNEFGRFCVEFKILVKPHKIAEIFKKNAKNSKELNYANFLNVLQKLSICANEEKKQYLMERIKIYKMKLKEVNEKNKKEGNTDEKNDQNKTKEKEENLSGIKSEGEAEDEKCEQEKNLENQNNENNKEKNNNDINNNNENININDKKSSNSKNTDKDNEKKSNNSNNNNMEQINEIKEENNIDSNDENNNNEKKQENNKKKQKKKNQNNNNNNQNDKPISTNLKYYQKIKAKMQSKNKKKKNKINTVKPKTNSFLIMETKEEIQDKINKLKEDYDKLNQKTNIQLEEEFYQYLEIDDINSYRKKMVGYLTPFLNRENNSRFPLQSVSRPIKRDPKMQKEMHKILVQRHEEMKREKELKQMKEKDILFEKRKKKFEIDNKKIQQKMSKKNDYLQFKINEEDYQKEKMNKITWQQIQKSDYDTFIINEKDKIKNPNLEEIFTNQSHQFEEVGDYIKNLKVEANGNKENNINRISNNKSNNLNGLNLYESSSKTERASPKFDVNISRISSGKNPGNNSVYDIVNSMESKK